MGKVVGVVSLKGGVGKTSVVAALGDALADMGKKVLLVDGNISAPNLGLHFNIFEPKVSLHNVLTRKNDVSEAVHTVGNLDIIPSSLFRGSETGILKLKDRLSMIRDKYDIILLDSSPSLGEETLGVMLASDEIVVVSTPDHPTLSNTISSIKLARQRGVPIVGIVLNRVYGKNFELTMRDVEEVAEVPVMALIPHDVKVLRALSEFTPYTSFRPNSKASDEFRKLASLLVGERYEPPRIRRFFTWVAPERQEINRQLYYDGLFR